MNVSIDPDAQQDLIEGKINRFKCERCEHESFVNHPFDYHDMHLEFYVQYIPFEFTQEEELYDRFLDNGFPSMEEEDEIMGIPIAPYFRTMHVVFDMAELVRYVIFRERLAYTRRKPA